MSRSLGAISIDFVALTAKFTKDIENAMGKFTKWQRDATRTGRAISAGIGIPISGLAVLAAKASDDIANAMNKISARTGALGPKMAAFEQSMRAVGRTADETAGQIADVLLSFSKIDGLKGEGLEKITSDFLDLNDKLGESASGSAGGFAKVAKAWNLYGDEVRTAMGSILIGSQEAGITLSDMIAKMQAGSPVFRSFGLSIDEAADLIGNLGAAGVDVEDVLPGLKRGVLELSDVGYSARDAVRYLVDSVRIGKTEAEQLATAAELVGDKAAYGLVIAIRQGALSLDQLGISAKRATGELDRVKNLPDTLGEKFTNLWRRFNSSIVPIGDAIKQVMDDLEPQFKAAFDGLERFGNWMEKLEPKTKAWAVAIGAIAVAAGPTLIALGSLSTVMGTVTSAAKAALLTLVPAIYGIGVALTAVTAIEFARWLYEEFRPVQEVAAFVIFSVQTTWEYVKEAFTIGTETLKMHFAIMINDARNMAGSLVTSMASVAQMIETTSLLMGKPIKLGAGSLWDLAGTLGNGTAAVPGMAEALQKITLAATAGAENRARLMAEFTASLQSIDREFQGGTRRNQTFAEFMGADIDEVMQAYGTNIDALKKKFEDWLATLELAPGATDKATEALERIGKSVKGVGTSLDESRQRMEEYVNDLKKGVGGALEEFGRGFSREFASLLVRNKANFKELVTSFVESIAQIVIQLTIAAPIVSALKAIVFGPGGSTGGGGGGGGGGGPPPGFPSPQAASAHGNAFNSGRLMAFASGTVLNGPMTFPMKGGYGLAGEAGPELIAPLLRVNGDLGVRSLPSTVNVQIIDQRGSGQTPQVSESTGPDGSRMLRIIIRDEIAKGSLDKDFGAAYGLRRIGARRG